MSHDNPTCIELQKEVQSLRVELERERDATLRILHLAEEAKRENERVKSELLEKLNQAQRLSMIGSWECDLQANHIWWSDETYRIFGVTPETYVPSFESSSQFIHPDDFARCNEAFEHSLQTGEPLELDVNLMIGEGLLKRCNAKGRIIYNDSGQPLRFLRTIMDITERKRAEETLRESEERFRSLIESAPEAIFVQCAGRFTYLNPAASRIFGASRPEELLGKEFMERMAPEYLDQIWERTTTDITARKLAEDALRKSEKMYRVIVETANEGIWSLDAEYRTTFVNRQMADMLSYSTESLLGRPMTEFLFEEDLSDHQAQAESRKRGMSGNFERRFRRKDGSECWTVISATSMRDADGQFAGSFAMVTDISARKKDENRLAALEMQLNHASRLATLGELAAGIAHEVNQPLCTIVNYAKACKNTLSCETPDLSKIYQWSDAIALAAARSGDIIRGMLGFARRHGSAHMMVDVRQLVADTMLLVGHEAKTRKISMQQEMLNHGLAVRADPVQLHQVLVNLLRNAMDAFHDLTLTDRRIVVQVRRVDGLVQVSVSDNGAGLPEEELAKIFDPFFTTKPQGLGLGLPISKSIIEDLRGKIWVTVNREAGLTFHFTLPEGKDNPQDVPK